MDQIVDQPADTYAGFEFSAQSSAAKALVERIHAEVCATEKRDRQRKSADVERFRETVNRFVGELLHAKARKGGSGRFACSMKASNFTQAPVGYTNVLKVREALKALGYMTHTEGAPRYGLSFDSVASFQQFKGTAAAFEATPALVALAASHGVALDAVASHFPAEQPLIEARASSYGDWQHKHTGRRVRFEASEVTRRLEEEVRDLNAFLSTFEIAGADHRHLYRLFNQCDDLNTYGWNKGGRIYANSGTERKSYQGLSGEERRAMMTIGGEPIAELDITASYLTIIHALSGQSLIFSGPSDDPYAAVGIDRELTKRWVTLSSGSGKPRRGWPKGFAAEFAALHGGRPDDVTPASMVSAEALKAYPALKRMGAPGFTWADLMWIESEIILGAMNALKAQGIPSLPVHDSLIVPASQASSGARALYLSFFHCVGSLPLIKGKGADEQAKREAEMVWKELEGLTPREPAYQYRENGYHPRLKP
jgi:hypothetical protein